MKKNAKPVRVYIRESRYYVEYYAAGKRYRVATMIDADVPEPANWKSESDWWRSSKHADELEPFVRDATRLRDGLRKKHQRDKLQRKRSYIDDLLAPLPEIAEPPKRMEEICELLIAKRERMEGKLSPGTVERRKNAVKLLRAFDRNFTYDDIDDKWLTEFRLWVESRYKATTLTGYLSDLRAMADFGIKEGILTETRKDPRTGYEYQAPAANKFEDLSFRAIYEPVRKTPKDDEDRVLRFMWAENRPLFLQIMFQRLTGFRVTWVCDLRRSEIDRRGQRIRSLNRKALRLEDFPITKPLAWLLAELEPYTGLYGPHTFALRHRSSVYYRLQKACEYSGVTRYGTHQLKKNYTSEWRRHTGDPDIVNFLTHHKPSGPTRVSAVHYVDPDEIYEAAREILDRVQSERWLPFFKSLKKVKPSGKKFEWSNEKGHWKNRKSEKVSATEANIAKPSKSARR